MIILRAARSTDAGKVGGILTEFAATTDWMPKLHTGAEDIAHAGCMIERGWVTVAEQDNRVVGFSACDGADLNSLYVAASARGQGIGSQLLDDLKGRSASLVLWTFEANTGAQKFYLRHGFEEVERGDGQANNEGLPDIKYAWKRSKS